MSNKIRKAVFPVAGFGTRFLPATKAMPKELMPIVDKPLVQYAVEEAIKIGFLQTGWVVISYDSVGEETARKLNPNFLFANRGC